MMRARRASTYAIGDEVEMEEVCYGGSSRPV